jgi:hypothetical protein
MKRVRGTGGCALGSYMCLSQRGFRSAYEKNISPRRSVARPVRWVCGLQAQAVCARRRLAASHGGVIVDCACY